MAHVHPEQVRLDPPAARRQIRLALVNMPFASSRRPSIQLGLLRAVLGLDGVRAESFYFNLELGAAIGWERYEALCHTRDVLLGEWLFAPAAFRELAPAHARYTAHHPSEIREVCAELGCDVDFLLDLRERVLPGFVEECVRRVDWSAFDVVGFSSIFEQNCAALALARRLKEEFPSLVTVFGGANFEDEMGLEYVRALPWIDYAVIGEGDEALPALVRALADDGDPTTVPGVATRDPDGTVRFAGRAPQVTNLDVLPEPDYDTYFTTAQQLGLPRVVRGQVVGLPFETARGCWWGAKHHCTFCGLNGLGMAFRSKTPERALRGIDELARRHRTYAFLSVDNILDQRYIGEVFGPLARQRKDYTFFFEVKANLSREQIRTLAQGGARIVQPGIESLSTRLLHLMRKGTTALQNVCFLKWGRYYGLTVAWNLLLGFPGEQPDDYRRQIEVIRLIPHLCPPGYVGRIRLDRFSPYFTDPQAVDIRAVRPIPAYGDTYPDTVNHDAIAYFFAYDAPTALDERAYGEVKETVLAWQRRWEGSSVPSLVYQRGADRLVVTDCRYGTPPRTTSLRGMEAQVYEACTSAPRSATGVLRLLLEQHPEPPHPEPYPTPDAVQRVLTGLTEQGLMLEDEGRYLGLALPINPNW
ncbi:RiPP maturation radical SAM C-methyltransferase [Kitasatospora sp. NPDC087314]|uniref:RiPP maturation radical SAM C-methyltransferase n=1 Tax=Kitasatospora sp. NPDC087314 TaxID=3364068 RepID=UPI0037F4D32D